MVVPLGDDDRPGKRGVPHADGADEVDELINANVVTVMSDAVMVPLCGIFALIVQRIHDMQTRHVVVPPPVVEVTPASIGGAG